MKLRNHQFSTQPQIFDGGYEHPWYKHTKKIPVTDYENKTTGVNATVRNIGHTILIKPNPPTKEAIERAKFVDKTYHWRRDNSVRPRKQRVT